MSKKMLATLLAAAFTVSFTNGMPVLAQEEQGSTANPIIWSDVPDPDIIRVGDAYYMTSTTMHMNPGVPIMKSYDLVNWKIVNYVYDILDDGDAQTFKNGQNCYGHGSWASSLRYNNGKYYIVFGSYDTNKTYIYQTEDIENGPWEHYELDGVYRDPSLFFEDDGSVYLAHGGGDIWLTELTADATAVKEGGLNKMIIQDASSVAGNLGNGLVAEGTHIQKIDGKYYVFNIVWPEGGIRTEIVHRADSLDGVYEGKVALSQSDVAGIAQGGIIDTVDGKWYGMLFEDHGAVGRTPCLVPVTWEDGWPVFGDAKNTGISSENIKYGFVSSDEFYQGEDIGGYAHFNGKNYADPVQTLALSEVGEEILQNGNIEAEVEPWIGNGTAEVSVTDEYYSSEAYSLYTTNRTATGDGPKQLITGKVEAGATYEFSAKVRYDVGPDQKQFNYDIQNGTSWTGIDIMGSTTLNKSEWGTIEGTYKIPEDADTSETFIFIETPWSGTPDSTNDLMDFYVDDVSFKLKAKAPTDGQAEGENDYNGSNLNLVWQWNHNPNNNNWSLTERAGYLRLKTGNVSSSLLEARNTLTQRTFGPECSGNVLIDVSNMKNGDYCGLGALQQKYGFVGVKMEGDEKYIIMVNGSSGKDEEIESIPLEQDKVYLKTDFDYRNNTDKAYFYYSLDGDKWSSIGQELKLEYTIPQFMGYRFALFNYATEKAGGYVDFDYFRLDNIKAQSEDSKTTLSAELGAGGEINGVPNKEVEIPLIMDELPEGNYSSISASFNIPEYLDVEDIEFNEKNITGECTYSFMNNQLKVDVNGENVGYQNKTSDKLFATIKLKVNDFVTEDTMQVVSADYVRVVGGNISYNIEKAASVIELKYMESGAISKVPGFNNPLISYKLGADPYALVYDGRVYVYMSSDEYAYDENGNITENTFSNLNRVSVISSDDMVNWTDHGYIPVAGLNGANDGNGIAEWANFSWAPAAAHKVIDGKDKFFLYFANGGGGIGVLTADSPIGPWVDPIGEPLVKWSTPGVAGVVWLFDPAVLVDDDGSGYLYFGGGIPGNAQDQIANPNTARVVKLGEDMISLDGDAMTIDAPFMFEDSGMHKYNGKYYYSYCINFSGTHPDNMAAGEIAYMTSDSPMGPFTYEGTFLKNPSSFFGVGGNNHHCVFEFNDKSYVVYHAQTLSYAQTGSGQGYRSPHINELKYYENGKIKQVKGDMKGVSQIANVNPYERVEAETIAWNAGILSEKCKQVGGMVTSINQDITDINNGDWISVSKANFGSVDDNSITTFKASVASNYGGNIEIYLDSLDGEVIGTLEVLPTGGEDVWQEVQCMVKNVEGVHNIFFKFTGDDNEDLFKLDYWQFEVKSENTKSSIFKYKSGFGGIVKGKFLQKVDYGEEGSEVTAKAMRGYHFVKWSDGVISATRKDINLGKNIEVKAIFEKDTEE